MSNVAKNKKIASYEDILKLPENLVGEIVDGELLVSPRPSPKHGLATSAINVKLGGPFGFGRGGPGGWWIIVEPELHLQNCVLVPDLAGWRKDSMPKIPDTPYFTVVPEWICEVLSPSNMQADRVRKVPKYAELGVNYLWLIDPVIKSLEILKLQNGLWVLVKAFADNDKFRVEPFEAVEFDLGDLWSD